MKYFPEYINKFPKHFLAMHGEGDLYDRAAWGAEPINKKKGPIWGEGALQLPWCPKDRMNTPICNKGQLK